MVTRWSPIPSQSYSRNKGSKATTAALRDELERCAMPGVKVILTGPPKNGIYPYRVESVVPALTGYSDAPLIDACRRLLNKLDDDTPVTLFSYQGTQLCRTNVAYGAGAER